MHGRGEGFSSSEQMSGGVEHEWFLGAVPLLPLSSSGRKKRRKRPPNERRMAGKAKGAGERRPTASLSLSSLALLPSVAGIGKEHEDVQRWAEQANDADSSSSRRRHLGWLEGKERGRASSKGKPPPNQADFFLTLKINYALIIRAREFLTVFFVLKILRRIYWYPRNFSS